MTRIDLITGILGAGKTTFLHGYAEYFIQKGEKIAILENDFGAVNIDMLMLKDLQCDHCQLEMIAGGGDPCCHRRRFKTQLISLGMQHFDRVIIEPSGIFDMDEFFDILHESPLDRWFMIGSILTILDAETEEHLSEEMQYLLASESACAGKLILSKQNPAESPEQTAGRILSQLNQALASIHCQRRFQEKEMSLKNWKDFTDQDYADFAAAGYRNEPYVKQFRTDALHSTTHYFMHIAIPEQQISDLIYTVMHDPACGKIYRIKGTLPAENGGFLKINAVHEKIEIAPVKDGQAVLIVIGDPIRFTDTDQYFRKANTDPAYVSI